MAGVRKDEEDDFVPDAAAGDDFVPDDAATAPKAPGTTAMQAGLLAAGNSAGLGLAPRVLAALDASDAVLGPRKDESFHMPEVHGVEKLFPIRAGVDLLGQAYDRVKGLTGRNLELSKQIVTEPRATMAKFSKAYDEQLPKYRQGYAQAAEDHPVATFAGNMAPALLTGRLGAAKSALQAAVGSGLGAAGGSEADFGKAFSGDPEELKKLLLGTGVGAGLGAAGYAAPITTGVAMGGYGLTQDDPQMAAAGAATVLGGLAGRARAAKMKARGQVGEQILSGQQTEAGAMDKARTKGLAEMSANKETELKKLDRLAAGIGKEQEGFYGSVDDRMKQLRESEALANKTSQKSYEADKAAREEAQGGAVKEADAQLKATRKAENENYAYDQRSQKAVAEQQKAVLDLEAQRQEAERSAEGKLGREYQSDYEAMHQHGNVPDEQLSPEALARRKFLQGKQAEVAERRLTAPTPEERTAEFKKALIDKIDRQAAALAGKAGVTLRPMEAAAPTQTPITTATPSSEFAKRVLDTAQSLPADHPGRFGEKVLLNHVYEAMKPQLSSEIDYPTFQKALLYARRDSRLPLTRADLTPALNPKDVAASEIQHLGDSVHFVTAPPKAPSSAVPPPAQTPAPNAPIPPAGGPPRQPIEDIFSRMDPETYAKLQRTSSHAKTSATGTPAMPPPFNPEPEPVHRPLEDFFKSAMKDDYRRLQKNPDYAKTVASGGFPERHPLFGVPDETASSINETKSEGGRRPKPIDIKALDDAYNVGRQEHFEQVPGKGLMPKKEFFGEPKSFPGPNVADVAADVSKLPGSRPAAQGLDPEIDARVSASTKQLLQAGAKGAVTGAPLGLGFGALGGRGVKGAVAGAGIGAGKAMAGLLSKDPAARANVARALEKALVVSPEFQKKYGRFLDTATSKGGQALVAKLGWLLSQDPALAKSVEENLGGQ